MSLVLAPQTAGVQCNIQSLIAFALCAGWSLDVARHGGHYTSHRGAQAGDNLPPHRYVSQAWLGVDTHVGHRSTIVVLNPNRNMTWPPWRQVLQTLET